MHVNKIIKNTNTFLFSGKFGKNPVAAHGVLLQITILAFMVIYFFPSKFIPCCFIIVMILITPLINI